MIRLAVTVLFAVSALSGLSACASAAPAESAAASNPASSSSPKGFGSFLPTATATTPAAAAERLYCRQEHEGWDRYLVKAGRTTVAFDVRTTDTGKEIRTPAWPHFTYFPLAAQPTPVDSPLIRIAHGTIEYTPNGYLALFGGKTRSAQQAAYTALWRAYEIDHWANDLCEVGLCS